MAIKGYFAFSVKNMILNLPSFMSATVLGTVVQFCHCKLKRSQTIHKQMGVALPQNFIKSGSGLELTTWLMYHSLDQIIRARY